MRERRSRMQVQGRPSVRPVNKKIRPALFWAALLLYAPAGFAQTFLAGAGKAEITPPPGFPTGGHGPAGDLARGSWNRLYARAFYLADRQGHGMILVSCDTFAMPIGLRAKVWEGSNPMRRPGT